LNPSCEKEFNIKINTSSGGNSANLEWALNDKERGVGRINNLRLGEAILLGCETLHRQALHGLHTNAITLTAEIIVSKLKPSSPTGDIAQNASGEAKPIIDRGIERQVILTIGKQAIAPYGLQAPEGINS
jgi:predicted amino acid racemase